MPTDDPLIQSSKPTIPGWWWGRARSGLARRPWDITIEHDGERLGLCVRLQADGERPRHVPFRYVVAEWGSELVVPTAEQDTKEDRPRLDKELALAAAAVADAENRAIRAESALEEVDALLRAATARLPRST